MPPQAEDPGDSGVRRSSREQKPNRQQDIRDSIVLANEKAKIIQTRAPPKKHYIYLDNDEEEEVGNGNEEHEMVEESSDEAYVASEASEGASTGTEKDIMEIDNEEIVTILQRKTEPAKRGQQSRLSSEAAKNVIDNGLPKKRRRKSKAVTQAQGQALAAEVPSQSPPSKQLNTESNDSGEVTAADATAIDAGQQSISRKTPPIYYFYELVDNNAAGQPGDTGDKHYRCFHGGRKILTVKKSMKATQSGLINHLRSHFPQMHLLYEALKSRNGPPSLLELQIASNKIPDDAVVAVEHFRTLKTQPGPLESAFKNQGIKSEASFNQSEFEKLLVNWIVSSDEGFTIVENPEFQKMLQYVHHRSQLQIPSPTTIRRRVTNLGVTISLNLKTLIQDLKGKVSISLDAWTSANGYAFMGIVMHYVSNTWTLEELLIDFRELIGQHTGANMAAAVFETLKDLGLERRICVIMSDNASNNDTMMVELSNLLNEIGVTLDPIHARGRCMPHTVHLAAVKLLEGIGALTAEDLKSCHDGYQENTTTHEFAAVEDQDVEEEEDDIAEGNAIEKLRKIVRGVRSSPQRRQLWLEEVVRLRRDKDNQHIAKMLILDVRTRWASTHQMCERALEYQDVIDVFVAKQKPLRRYELGKSNWESIRLVTDYLAIFRAATTQMSSTSKPMLSTTHAIFKGLQDSLVAHITQLPKTGSLLRDALLAAHRKLSDYFFIFDKSQYYIWSILLDPRIGYHGLLADADDDPDLAILIDSRKKGLEEHYKQYYTGQTSHSGTGNTVAVPAPHSHISFTSRYNRKPREDRNELQEFFGLCQENFDSCDPVKWWGEREAQFPNLSKLARDIFSIPGSAVSVERIFSGGRDTISLRRASLKPQMIKTLMLAKQSIHKHN